MLHNDIVRANVLEWQEAKDPHKSARNINKMFLLHFFLYVRYPCIFHKATKKLQQRKILSNCCSSRNMISYSFRFTLAYKVAWQAFFNLQTASKTRYVIKATDLPLLLDIFLKFYVRYYSPHSTLTHDHTTRFILLFMQSNQYRCLSLPAKKFHPFLNDYCCPFCLIHSKSHEPKKKESNVKGISVLDQRHNEIPRH